jgi:CTP:molybdopterin cytidylyltransferase MocA
LAEEVAREERRKRAEAFLECALEGYREGDLTLEGLRRMAQRVIAAAALQPGISTLMLGRVIESAHQTQPVRRRRGPKGVPAAIRREVRNVTALVCEHEGLAPTSEAARARVMEIFNKGGVPLTRDQVRDFYRRGPSKGQI